MSTDYEADLEAIRREMDSGPITPAEVAEHRAAMAVVDLMSATHALSELAASKTNEQLVRREANDIELAYTRLGRMLSRLRQPDLRAVG